MTGPQSTHDIYIIGEDHADMAGVTLIRKYAEGEAGGRAVMMEWFAHLNGPLQAYKDGKITRDQMKDVLTVYSPPEFQHRVPALIEMIDELNAKHIPLIAYDVRAVVNAFTEDKTHKDYLTTRRKKHIEERIQSDAAKEETDREKHYLAIMIEHWDSPITKKIEEIVRDSFDQGITNEDIIAARVIHQFHVKKSYMLAGANHINGGARPDIGAYGIVDDALRAMGHKTHLAIAADELNHFMPQNALKNYLCETSEKIDQYVIVNPATQAIQQTFNDNPSLEKALAEVNKQFQDRMFILQSLHLGSCTENDYPKAENHPGYGPELQILKQISPKPRDR